MTRSVLSQRIEQPKEVFCGGPCTSCLPPVQNVAGVAETLAQQALRALAAYCAQELAMRESRGRVGSRIADRARRSCAHHRRPWGRPDIVPAGVREVVLSDSAWALEKNVVRFWCVLIGSPVVPLAKRLSP